MNKKPKKQHESQELPQDLEGALKGLEKVVATLEEPDLPLEQALELFERGSRLSEICYHRLKEAEKKVEVLVKKVPHPNSREDFEKKDFVENA